MEYGPFELIRKGRRTLLAAARVVGISNLLAHSEWRRRKLLILCYHGVSLRDEHEWNPQLFVSPGFLRRRFEILRNQDYSVLPLDVAVTMLANGTLPKRSVVLTFDDGFYNFSAAAVPLLEEFRYSATVYLSSYFCLHQRPILLLTLRYLLWRARHQPFPNDLLPEYTGSTDLSEVAIREKIAALLAAAPTFSLNGNAQLEQLGHVAASLGIDWQDFLKSRIMHLMTQSEVSDVARRGMDVQLHTHRHRTPRDIVAFRNEVAENREIIEKLTGKPAVHFCYPSGDYVPEFFPVLNSMGIKSATTCVSGLARTDHNPLLLPRFIDTMLQPELVFEAWLAGVAELTSKERG